MYRISCHVFPCNHALPFFIYLDHGDIGAGLLSSTVSLRHQSSKPAWNGKTGNFGEARMQLEIKHLWKKTLSSVTPRVILALAVTTLAVLSAGCSRSGSAQPKAPAPVEVNVA